MYGKRSFPFNSKQFMTSNNSFNVSTAFTNGLTISSFYSIIAHNIFIKRQLHLTFIFIFSNRIILIFEGRENFSTKPFRNHYHRTRDRILKIYILCKTDRIEQSLYHYIFQRSLLLFQGCRFQQMREKKGTSEINLTVKIGI